MNLKEDEAYEMNGRTPPSLEDTVVEAISAAGNPCKPGENPLRSGCIPAGAAATAVMDPAMTEPDAMQNYQVTPGQEVDPGDTEPQKIDQASVSYTTKSPGTENCASCPWFVDAKEECGIVEATPFPIVAAGWCRLWGTRNGVDFVG